MKIDALVAALPEALGDKLAGVTVALGEVTAVVRAVDLRSTMLILRDLPTLRFEELIDLCGVDYSTYGGGTREGSRFAVVCHLLSLANNWRLRVRVFAPDDDFPVLPSLVDVWPGANWYEREAFDFYGIMFTGHPDLRRLLTDYGFVGHPFR
jgi:NADH-quinone oxidoreductase subunit C